MGCLHAATKQPYSALCFPFTFSWLGFTIWQTYYGTGAAFGDFGVDVSFSTNSPPSLGFCEWLWHFPAGISGIHKARRCLLSIFAFEVKISFFVTPEIGKRERLTFCRHALDPPLAGQLLGI